MSETGASPDPDEPEADGGVFQRWPWLPWLVGPGIALVIFAPAVFFGEALVGGDNLIFALPQFQAISEMIARGVLPSWNPSLGLGLPVVGDASLPLFYPFNFLHWLFSPALVLQLFLLFHLILLYLGFYWLMRSLRLSREGACLAAMTAAFGGAALSQCMTPMYVFGTAWIPWAARAFVWPETGGGRVRGLALAGLSFALIALCGALEFVLAAALVSVAFGRALGLSWRVSAARLAAIAVLAMGLSAVVLLPMFAVLPEALRSEGMDLSWCGRWSLSPLELCGLILPRAFDEGGLPRRLVTWNTNRVWYLTLYMGLLPASFAWFGFAAIRARDKRALACALILLVSLPLAFGIYNPVYRFLFDKLPLMQGFRFPAKAFVPAGLALAALAGLGFDRWLAAPPQGRRWPLPMLAIMGLLIGFAAAALFVKLPGLRWRASRPLLVGLAAILGARRLPRRWAPALWLFLTAAELALAGGDLLHFLPRQAVGTPPSLLGSLRAEQAERGTPVTYGLLKTPDAFPAPVAGDYSKAERWQLTAQQALVPNIAAPYRVRAAYAFSPLRSRRWHRLWLAMEARDTPLPERYLREGVTHVVYTQSEEAELLTDVTLLQIFGPWISGRFERAGPWAAVYDRLSPAADLDAAVEQVMATGFDPKAAAVVEDPEGALPAELFAAKGGAPDAERVRLISRGGGRLELAVAAGPPGLLVIREAYAEGWRAAVNDRPQALVPVDVLFRGVPIGEEGGRVLLSYEPPGWSLAWPISLVFLVLSLGMLRVKRAAINPNKGDES